MKPLFDHEVPLFDPDEERERQDIERAIAAIAVADHRFQPWWAVYRNHDKGPVIIMPHHRDDEGTYLWHFHVTRPLRVEEQAELLSAMTDILHAALEGRRVEIKAAGLAEDDSPIAYLVFSVPMAPDEAQRRREARRVRGEVWEKVYRRT